MLSPSYPLCGLLAFGACAAGLPLVKVVAARWRVYDQPGELKIHRAPIARIGGLAMMFGIAVCTVPAAIKSVNGYGVCLGAALAIWVVGFIDDLRSLSVWIRFGVQCTVGACLWMSGWRLNWTSSALFDLALTTLFVVFLINAMNWLDGMDGLASSTTAMVAAGLLWLPLDPFSRIVAWSLIGVCLSMLLVNFPPASVFMGDSGSTLIGVLLAFLCLSWVRSDPDTHSIVSPVLCLSVPIADGGFAILRRLRTGRSPFRGDRRHFYDLLLQRDWTAYKVILASLLASGGLAILGRLSYGGEIIREIVVVAASVFLLSVAFWLGSLRPDRVRSAEQQTAPIHLSGITLRRFTHS